METFDKNEQISFLPHLQESFMDELRTTEGMIFKDEGAKKLFLDTKSLILDTLGSAFTNFDNEAFGYTLESYVSWDTHVEEEIISRMHSGYKDIENRLLSVTVLYAKYLYAHTINENSVVISKPKVESLLKGMFTRICRMSQVKNGSFFSLDPIRQDFVLRDVFRLTLGNDCIQVVEKEKEKEKEAQLGVLKEQFDNNLPEKVHGDSEIQTSQTQQQEYSNYVPEDEKETETHHMSQKNEMEYEQEKDKEDDIYPDDSISRVMEKMPENSRSVMSTASARSKISEFHKPNLIRRVKISDELDSNSDVQY
jgi:hypothetical protein